MSNSCFVALIATELVSIGIPWLLLPPEVGVNRHGHVILTYLHGLLCDYPKVKVHDQGSSI